MKYVKVIVFYELHGVRSEFEFDFVTVKQALQKMKDLFPEASLIKTKEIQPLNVIQYHFPPYARMCCLYHTKKNFADYIKSSRG